MDGLYDWLAARGLERYAELLAKEHVTLDVLGQITNRDLHELGVPMGDRIRILNAAVVLREGARAANLPVPQLRAPERKETEHRAITVLICDLVNSVVLSREYGAERIRDVYHALRSSCSEIVGRFGGFVARQQSDQMLACFGYPDAMEDNAERAIRAGLEIIRGMAELNAQLQRDSTEPLAVHIGLATGPVVIGDIVSGGTTEVAAVTGDAPNLAARLQAESWPNTVLADQATRELAGEQFEYVALEPQLLKGFEKPVTAWLLLGERLATRFEAHARHSTRFIGRQERIAALIAQWEKARKGEGGVALISGRAGIGKSRMTDIVREQIMEQARVEGIEAPVAIRLQCSSMRSNSPLHPFIRAIGRLAGFERQDSLSGRATKLARLLEASGFVGDAADRALIAELLELPHDSRLNTDLGSREKRLRQLDLLQAWLQPPDPRRQPLLLAIEDLQWIDPTSRQLLERLIADAHRFAILILITHRIDHGEDMRPDGHGGTEDHYRMLRPGIAVHEIEELDPPLARQLMVEVAGNQEIPPDVAAAILDKGEGIPLYIEVLTREWLDSVNSDNAGDGRKGGRAANEVPVPQSLSSSLMARVDRLGPAKDIALQASVIGREFDLAILEKVTQLSGPVLQANLDRMARAEILRVIERSGERSYVFRHALFQDVAYGSMLSPRRKDLHLRVALALEDEQAVRPEISTDLIAQHYARDSQPGKAVRLWLQAAEGAIQRSAHHEAANMLRQALSHLSELANTAAKPALELELRRKLAAALRSILGYAASEVEETYRRADELCAGGAPPETRFDIGWGLFQCYLVKGEIGLADHFAERLMLGAEVLPDALRADAFLANGMVQLHQGEFEEARAALEQATALTNPRRDAVNLFTHGQNPGVFCRSNLAHTLAFLGRASKARKLVEENLEIARARSTDPAHLYTYVNALTFAARVYLLLRDTVAVKRVSGELLQLAKRHKYAYYEAIAETQIGWAEATERPGSDGIEAMRKGLAALDRTGTELAARGFYLQLAELHVARGEKAAGDAALRKALSGNTGTRIWDVEAFRVEGLIAMLEPLADPQAAERGFRTSLLRAREQGALTLELRTLSSYLAFLRAQGRTDEATVLLKQSISELDQRQASSDVCDAQVLLQRFFTENGV